MSKAASLVKAFIKEKAPSCVHPPEGLLKHRFVTPSYSVKAGADDESSLPERSRTGHYLQMYDWDACFFSQAAHRINIHGLSQDVVFNFLSLKKPDGLVPRTVSPQRIWDAGDSCKPFLCQTLLHQLKQEKWLPEKIPAAAVSGLQEYLQYFIKHRALENGLYRWRNVLESGVDDNLALIAPREAARDEDESFSKFHDGELAAVDLSSYLCAEFRAFAEILRFKEKNDEAQLYLKLADKTATAIEKLSWNEELGLYCNFYPGDGKQVSLRSWTGLVPALFGLVDSKRCKRVIEANILSGKHFFRPAGVSSYAASELLYNNATRGLYGRAIVSNWQGPVWILSNALVVRCLLREGYKQDAEELSRRVIDTLHKDIERNQTLHENYHAETGKALWAPQFMSWNILALELVELLE